MLKRPITYTNFDDEVVTDTFYFNLTEAELIEMDVSYKQGLADALQRIVEAKDNASIVREFKKIILSAYGVRSEDGKRFIKNEQIAEEFTQTPAYSALFMELATDENAAADFLEAVVPKSMMEKARQQDKPIGPPPSQIPPPPPSI
jgi:hypothetical protein